MKLRAPGKVNLQLRVLGRRATGFTKSKRLFVPISLADEISVEVFAGAIRWGFPAMTPESQQVETISPRRRPSEFQDEPVCDSARISPSANAFRWVPDWVEEAATRRQCLSPWTRS